MKIVGIAGLPRSGKDSLAELFMDSGYYGVSLGDIVRDEARVRHANEPDPISVKNMTETSNYLRMQKGADFALKEALLRYEKAQKEAEYTGLVVFSVRAPVEADFILKNGGELIWVEASDKVRHLRTNANLRDGEKPASIKEMKEHEALQEKPQPNLPENIQMNTSYIRSKATVTFTNNGNNIDDFISNAKKKFDLNGA
jgi:dephospho-CoA kinase